MVLLNGIADRILDTARAREKSAGAESPWHGLASVLSLACAVREASASLDQCGKGKTRRVTIWRPQVGLAASR